MNNNTNIRPIAKISKRENSVGFSLRCFTSTSILSDYLGFVEEINTTLDDSAMGKEEKILKARETFAKLVEVSNTLENDPIHVKETCSKINRMSRSIGSDIFGIDYESKKPTTAWITIEHEIQEKINFYWKVAGNYKKSAQAAIDDLQKQIYRRIGSAGVIVTLRDGSEIHYYGFAASASHQKNEKLIMADGQLMKIHEEAIWFGLKYSEFIKLDLNGAAISKMRANLLRPIRVELKTSSGEKVYLHDIIIKDDIVVERHYSHARKVGVKTDDGDVFVDGEFDEERTVDDGGVHYLVPMNSDGQTTSFGLKGYGSDMTSAIKTAAKLEGKEIPDFGSKKIMMGAGCWKFDKLGLSWDEFVKRVDKLANKYPGINQVWLLREADELEGEEKVRRLTRSLIQQWITLSDMDIRKITSSTRRHLAKSKTMAGALNSLTQKNLLDSERSEFAKLFENAPWLVLNHNVQDYLRIRYEKKQAEAAGNKIRTEGSYPYIQEDLVAVAQIQIFGADPNRNDLGVLKAGEISVAGVEDGEKVLAVRFPANYLTARVKTNRSCVKAFESAGNTAMLSIYDDILVIQDGDVDGDEMAIIRNHIAIEATEQMIEKFNPPTILFEHGAKAKKEIIGNRDRLIKTIYEDLWKAKKFDGVGKYANLATLLCHLASEAYARNDMKMVEIRLNQMSLASTGAILAIDQVKGNAVSNDLINRLDEIGREVRALCDHKMPWTQQFVKGIDPELCMPASDVICDKIGKIIMDETGPFDLDTGCCVWNEDEAKRALLGFGVRTTSVRKSIVCGTVLDKLADNWFNDKNPADKETFDKIRNREAVGSMELIDLLWRNACALEFRMHGDNLVAKKEEYLKTVREMLYAHACSTTWVGKDGHVFSDVEKKASVASSAVLNVLRSKTDGRKTMFVLKVFAKELNWSLKKNAPDNSKFLFNDELDLDIDNDDEELYSDEEGFIEEESELEPMEYSYEECEC